MIDFLSAFLIYTYIKDIAIIITLLFISWMIIYPTIYLGYIKYYSEEEIKEKILEKKKTFIAGFIFILLTMLFVPSDKQFVAMYGLTHTHELNNVVEFFQTFQTTFQTKDK